MTIKIRICGVHKGRFTRPIVPGEMEKGMEKEILIITGDGQRGYRRWADVCDKCLRKLENCIKELEK